MSGLAPELRVLDRAEAAIRDAAGLVEEAARSAIRARGRFLLVLAGGSTPRDLYRRLANDSEGTIDWHAVHLFWGDERCVPPDASESNYRMARESLLDAVPVPAAQVHRIRGELSPDQAAAAYRRELVEFFGAAEPADAETTFDLALLGIGEDGHTASLFPGSPAPESGRWAEAVEAPDESPVRHRVTLTRSALQTSRRALFLATGEGKADAVAAAFGAHREQCPPAGRIRAREGTSVVLDRAAAAGLG